MLRRPRTPVWLCGKTLAILSSSDVWESSLQLSLPCCWYLPLCLLCWVRRMLTNKLTNCFLKSTVFRLNLHPTPMKQQQKMQNFWKKAQVCYTVTVRMSSLVCLAMIYRGLPWNYLYPILLNQSAMALLESTSCQTCSPLECPWLSF